MSRELFRRSKPNGRGKWTGRPRVGFRERLRLIVRVFKFLAGAAVISAVVYFGPPVAGKIRGLLYRQKTLSVQKLILEGNNMVSREEIIEKLGVGAGENIMDLDLNVMARNLEEMPAIKSALIKRHYPSALYVKVIERRPLMIVDDGRKLMVDGEGVVIGRVEASSPSLPTVTGIRIGNRRSADAAAVEMIARLREAALSGGLDWPGVFSLVDVSRDDCPVIFMNGKIPVLIGEDAFESKMLRLAKVLPRINGKETPVSYIDLRFDRRVVVGMDREQELPGEGQVKELG